MPQILERSASRRSLFFYAESERPTAVRPASLGELGEDRPPERSWPEREAEQPQSPNQELDTFGAWVDEPIWAPPLDATERLAESMVRLSRPFTSMERRWDAVVYKHRNEFTQVREIELGRASIRLPQGRLFVAITEQKNFDKIAETIPDSVLTRCLSSSTRTSPASCTRPPLRRGGRRHAIEN